MKRTAIIICALTIVLCLIGAFVGCGAKEIKIGWPSEWPDNQYTAVIPKLEKGEIKYDTEYVGIDTYYLQIKNITIEDSLGYIDLLKQNGYVVKKDTSDESYYSYTLKNKSKKSEVSIAIAKDKTEEGYTNQLGITIYINK